MPAHNLKSMGRVGTSGSVLPVTLGSRTMSLLQLVLPVLSHPQLNWAVGEIHELAFLSAAGAEQPRWQTGVALACLCLDLAGSSSGSVGSCRLLSNRWCRVM